MVCERWFVTKLCVKEGRRRRRRTRRRRRRDTESKTRHKDVGNEKQVWLISRILQAIYIFILTISNFPIHCCTFFIMVYHFLEFSTGVVFPAISSFFSSPLDSSGDLSRSLIALLIASVAFVADLWLGGACLVYEGLLDPTLNHCRHFR